MDATHIARKERSEAKMIVRGCVENQERDHRVGGWTGPRSELQRPAERLIIIPPNYHALRPNPHRIFAK